MKEEKIWRISVVFSVEFANRELETDDFDPRILCPEFDFKWGQSNHLEDKRWDSFTIEGVLTVEDLHAWLEKMPMKILKTPTKDLQGNKWMAFKAKTSEAVLEMFCHPFFKSGNTFFSAKRRAMLKEFGS